MAVISTAIASAIMTGMHLIGIGAATISFLAPAIIFGARMLVAGVISRIFAPKMSDGNSSAASQGVRIQLPPATNNKLPMLYGTAWLKPIITDAKISSDQKTMWYVLTFTEVSDAVVGGTGAPQFSTVRWGDKTLNFDAVDQTLVVSWTNDAGETETNVNGKINVYRYVNGSNVPQAGTPNSAITVLQDAQIPAAERWAATDLMTRAAFLVFRVAYDQDIGLTGLENITTLVSNTLQEKPGTAIQDYLNNDRYGCAIPLANIDTVALSNLDAYSDVLIPYTDSGGNPQTQPRYRVNGVVDTSQSCFDNLQQLCAAADSWLQWNEATARWGVIINRGYDQAAGTYPAQTIGQLFNITDDNVIGSIEFAPFDLSGSYNSVEVSYPDNNIYDQVNSAYIDLDAIDRNPNEPDNVLTLVLPFTNGDVTAKYIANRRLIQSREDLSVRVTMDFSGIQIDAGDVIRFNSDKFQWTDKLFRVVQVQEGKDDSGFLYAALQLSEYNSQVYANIPIQEYVPSPNTGITDPNIANQPAAPTLTNFIVDSPTGQFTINTVIPASGTYGAIEIYYSDTTDTLSEYTLLKTLLPTDSNTYVNGATIPYIVVGLPRGSYFFRSRVVTMTGIKSPYSLASTGTGGGGSSTITGPVVNVGSGAASTSSLDIFPASTVWTGSRTTVMTITTTGGPVKVVGSASIQYSIKDVNLPGPPPTVQRSGAAQFQVRLLKDNVYLEVYTAAYPTYVDFTVAFGKGVIPNVPFVFYHTPPAGTHNYQIELYAANFDEAGAIFSSNGTMYGEFYTLVEETTA